MKPGFYTVELVSKVFLKILQVFDKYLMMTTRCTRPGILVKFGIFMILMMTPRCTRLGRCQRGISTSALLVPEHLDRFFVDIERFKIMKNIIFNTSLSSSLIPQGMFSNRHRASKREWGRREGGHQKDRQTVSGACFIVYNFFVYNFFCIISCV